MLSLCKTGPQKERLEAAHHSSRNAGNQKENALNYPSAKSDIAGLHRIRSAIKTVQTAGDVNTIFHGQEGTKE